VVGTHGSEFGSDEIEEASDMVEFGSVLEEGLAQVLSEVGGGLPPAPPIFNFCRRLQ
jgi:hypothetical protein